MDVQAGIDPILGVISVYAPYRRVDFECGKVRHTEEVIPMYEKIKAELNGRNLGCLCICLYYTYSNQIRDEFIEEGYKCGFKNVEIVDCITSFYLYAMSQINYKPLNGNAIWIKYGTHFYIWQIKDQKAKFTGRWYADISIMSDLERIVKKSKLNKGPDVLLSHDEVDEGNIRKISTSCQFFKYTNKTDFYSSGSLLKARMTAGDRDLVPLNVITNLSADITLIIRDEKITSFKEFHPLPIFFLTRLIKKSNERMLEIKPNYQEKEIFKLPRYDDMFLIFEIDTNGIFSVTFKQHQNDYGQEHDSTSKLSKTLKPHIFTFSNLSTCFTIPSKSTSVYSNALGIDLGTTRCCAAVSRQNGITCVPLDNNGERLLPSYVGYDEENVKCGQVVVNRLRNYAKSTIFDSKRILGRDFGEIEIDEKWPFILCQENKKLFMEINGFNGKRKITAEEVASDLLKHIKLKSEEFQGNAITNVVITVPAAFTETQREATKEAAKLIGWNEIVLLPESVAAAFAYYIDRPMSNNSIALLLDLGGGTLDVCIFKVETNQIQIISNIGDSKLGGRNFDTVLINYFKNLLESKFGIFSLRDKKYRLMLECQKIKEDLSSTTNCSLDVDDYDTAKQGQISISHKEFERMTKPLLNKIQNTIMAALYSAKYEATQINQILLVGGGSRMPMVQNLLKEIFPNAERCVEEHPDEVVAIGAAYYAYSIFS